MIAEQREASRALSIITSDCEHAKELASRDAAIETLKVVVYSSYHFYHYYHYYYYLLLLLLPYHYYYTTTILLLYYYCRNSWKKLCKTPLPH